MPVQTCERPDLPNSLCIILLLSTLLFMNQWSIKPCKIEQQILCS